MRACGILYLATLGVQWTCGSSAFIKRVELWEYKPLCKSHQAGTSWFSIFDVPISILGWDIGCFEVVMLFLRVSSKMPGRTLNINSENVILGGPNGRAVWGVGLRPLSCWDCGFVSRRGHGCSSLVNVVCCQVERSVRRADHLPYLLWCVVECDLETSRIRSL